jgi:hypothetical protein
LAEVAGVKLQADEPEKRVEPLGYVAPPEDQPLPLDRGVPDGV